MNMNIRLTIMTCSGREDAFSQTLESLWQTDVVDKPHVYHDEERHPNRRISQLRTAHRILVDAQSHKWDYLLFCEDDVLFNHHILHNLQTWSYLDRVKVATLYDHGKPVRGDVKFVDPCIIGGSQAILISRDWLPEVLDQWDRGYGHDTMQDLRIYGSLCGRNEILPIHTPNLVQHQGCASTWGGQPHYSLSFDPAFRR